MRTESVPQGFRIMANIQFMDCYYILRLAEVKINIMTVHSNSPYPGSLGPGTVRNSETAVLGNIFNLLF